MTATGHAIIGTVIAAKIGNPVLAVPIAIASHFLADALPHWDTGYHRDHKTKTKFFVQSLADVLIGFLAAYALVTAFFPATNLVYAYFIVIMAQLPDWITAPYLFFNWNFPPFNWTYKFGKIFDTHLGMPWGFVNQVAIVVAIIIFGRAF